MGLLCGLHHYNHANIYDEEGILTVGEIPSSAWGYFNWIIEYGELTDNLTLDETGLHNARGVFSSTFADFNVFYTGNPLDPLTQDAFTTFIVEDGAGVLREYNSADAFLFTYASGLYRWAWGNGASDKVYGAGDVGKLRVAAVII
jgi:hypothetical protein